MEIYSHFPNEELYTEFSEFLAFLGMYEDHRRIRNYKKFLKKLANRFIKGKTVVEAGAGFGIFSQYMAKLGAKKVYAVEQNWFMLQYLKNRFKRSRTVEVIEASIEEFEPPEPVSLLVHDFWGTMLYDESLYALENLKFKPERIFPNKGFLKFNVYALKDFKDPLIDNQILKLFPEGVVVSDLIPVSYKELEFPYTIAKWEAFKGLETYESPILPPDKDLIVFSLFIYDESEEVCRAELCSNWAFTWTPVRGRQFKIEFIEVDKGYFDAKLTFFEKP